MMKISVQRGYLLALGFLLLFLGGSSVWASTAADRGKEAVDTSVTAVQPAPMDNEETSTEPPMDDQIPGINSTQGGESPKEDDAAQGTGDDNAQGEETE